MRWALACLLIAGLTACDRAPRVDTTLPVVDSALPAKTAIQVTVRAETWIIYPGPLLPEGLGRTHKPVRLDAEELRESSAFEQSEDIMAALKARAPGDRLFSVPVALRVAPSMLLEAVYPIMFVLVQTGYGPFGAQVQTPAGEGFLPFEPRAILTASPDWHEPPEDRGKVDWQTAGRLESLDLMIHGPPRPCHALTVWQTPMGVWAAWQERWVRHQPVWRSTPKRSATGEVPWTTLAVALAAAPIGERCASPLLISRMDVPWGGMLDAVLAMRAQGFDAVRLLTSD